MLVEGEPQLREPVAPPNLPAGRWLATLPSPLAFARATRGAVSPRALAADVLAPQVHAWSTAGCALVVLSDPFLPREKGVEALTPALRELPTNVPYALHLPFGDAGPLLEGLADAPVGAVGVDFYATALDSIPEGYPKEIAAGVIDSRSSALEDPEEIARFAGELRQRNPAGISLSMNGDLQFVPEPIAREKLALLGRARALVAEGVLA